MTKVTINIETLNSGTVQNQLMRGHRAPIENELLKAAIVTAQAEAKARIQQVLIRKQQAKFRLAAKIEQMFGREAASTFMAGGAHCS
ncbi:hypothetical protein CCL15_25065 [Pseudomonas syringae]|uniref:hypothetical protein n=1 Tax=Pseudomonas syringae TaxID=317 RepID=UPI000BB67001|nr:hypothetical protein [Pseudomonas syringae]PBP64545.1 hypothetical protein CCL15_25065 [Pseudomonas syringae]